METNYKDSTQRNAVLLSYQGTNFHGSQYQSQGEVIRPTVQHALETALRQLGITDRVNLASRTDAGVHARGQVAHFDCLPETLANISDLHRGLNRYLPEDISVQAVQTNVGHQFHCRQNTDWRWYRYKISNNPARPVFERETVLWVNEPLDVVAMSKAANYLQGRHNFKSMKALNTPVLDDWCCLAYSSVSFSGPTIVFDVVADRFLYKMVRNLAGLLIAIGKDPHRFPPEIVPEVLDRQDLVFSQTIGPTAKPQGLTLMAIKYKTPFDFFESHRNEHLTHQPLSPKLDQLLAPISQETQLIN